MIIQDDYSAGEVFKIDIKFFFVGSPVRDYTVLVYTKQTVTVNYESATGPTNVLHMDGQKPSGFTDQQFWTMDHTSDPSPAVVVKPKDDYKGDSTV